MHSIKYLILSIFLFKCFFSFAQSNDVFIWFDNQVGIENTALYNGVEFKNIYNLLNNKHRFFETSDFVIGDVSYDNQTYFNVLLRYDLFGDQLIVQLKTSHSTNEILLLNEKISEFRIDNSFFEALNERTEENIPLTGFYQILTQNENFKLYKKNRKRRSSTHRNNTVYYEFNESNPEYILQTRDGFFRIARMRNLTSKFPQYRKELNNFKWNSKAFESNDSMLIAAINRLNLLLKK